MNNYTVETHNAAAAGIGGLATLVGASLAVANNNMTAGQAISAAVNKTVDRMVEGANNTIHEMSNKVMAEIDSVIGKTQNLTNQLNDNMSLNDTQPPMDKVLSNIMQSLKGLQNSLTNFVHGTTAKLQDAATNAVKEFIPGPADLLPGGKNNDEQPPPTQRRSVDSYDDGRTGVL